MARWGALLALLLVGSARAATPAAIDAALNRGAAFLLARQGEDGAWRSEDYGAFKDGYSQTPFVLSALLFAPPQPTVPAAYARGVDFLAGLVGASGEVEGYLAYPVYASGGALMVLSVPANARHAKARAALVRFLSARQLTEQHGWRPDDPSYGGFGYYTGPLTRPKDGAEADHLLSANLSSTLYAIGALQLAGVPRDDARMAQAARFVRRCQNFAEGKADPRFDDGGFFFTPANRIQNKADLAAGTDEAHPRYRSYGSMTADGLRALRRVGGPADAPRLAAADAWLVAHFDPEHPGGDYPPPREVLRRSVYYYWAWTTAHALKDRGDRARLDRLADAVLARQDKDGAWRNPATDLREDDPLVATPFAMAALAIARFVGTGEWRTAFDATTPARR
ncbi:MAG: terpene cyclase/mutase family protein [Myxococcales bacterium]|nr:terpene cyclase/mutase family protein [Myxococcales bacterium]